MFRSFFPRPMALFLSAIGWGLFCLILWKLSASQWPVAWGLVDASGYNELAANVSRFWSPLFLWFYVYYALSLGLFASAWFVLSPHVWQRWSILGSGLIVFMTSFLVQGDVAVNDWYGPFWDLIQDLLGGNSQGESVWTLYKRMLDFAGIAMLVIVLTVFNMFFVSHYIFRWRTAMNSYYMQNWQKIRHIEGASQRVQDDTMRFATTLESLGIRFLSSILTLVAFLPQLAEMSGQVESLPIIGSIDYSLVWVAIIWSLVGTLFLALVGIRLPGLEFANQRVEAAYRKELVYGEDDAARAAPPTVRHYFSRVRANYFRLYWHYCYFNVARYLYVQADYVVGYVVLGPAIAAGALTLGLLQQILNVFERVRVAFQYLVDSWTTIVELLSIYKRLRGFERHMDKLTAPKESI